MTITRPSCATCSPPISTPSPLQPTKRPASLLAALVRQGWLREHAVAATRLIDDATVAPAHDPELFGFAGSTLDVVRAARPAGRRRTRCGARLASGGDPAAADIEAFRAAALTVADGERRRAGAARRRGARRRLPPGGRVGDLAGDPPARRAAGRASPPGCWSAATAGSRDSPRSRATPSPSRSTGEPAPLRRAVDDPGFLHAPSIHQAEVAALLRNAHLTHGGGDDDPFAITITSQRVRLAQRIFDGVRAGRSLGAVLGYLVERDLHERGLDASVDNAREVSPLPGQELLPIPARRLDGLSLHKLWSDSEDHAVDHLVAGSQDAALRRKAAGVLRRLGVAVDAAADLLQAEQVHHMVRGQPHRRRQHARRHRSRTRPATGARRRPHAAHRHHRHPPRRRRAARRRGTDRRLGGMRPARHGPPANRRSTPGWRGASARWPVTSSPWSRATPRCTPSRSPTST